LHCQKNETAEETTPIAPALKNCTYRRENWLLNRMREQVRFSIFLTRFLYGEVASQCPKNALWVKTFLFCAKVVLGLGHFGTTWSTLHTLGQAQKIIESEIEASPMALHFFLAMQGQPSRGTITLYSYHRGVRKLHRQYFFQKKIQKSTRGQKSGPKRAKTTPQFFFSIPLG
jgi:hypothetical protein